MTKITDMINEIKEPEMDENILDEAHMTKEEKEKTAGIAFSKIRAEVDKVGKSSANNTRVKKVFSRKFIAIAAAMVVVLAFGAVAYAAGWFDLGVIETSYGKYEMISVEDSDQYNAAKEVADYYNTLSYEETYGISGKGWLDEDGATMNEEDKNNVFATMEQRDEKVQDIINKYDLRFERNYYYTDSAEKAFAKADVTNFLGTFWNINELKSNGSSAYTENHYTYTREGSISVSAGEKYSYGIVNWELNCYPSDVYISPSKAFVSKEEKNESEFMEWDFETKEGFPAKVASYEHSASVLLDDGTEDQRNYRYFKCFIPVGNRTVVFEYNVWIDDVKNDITQMEFESIIEKFDFNKIK